MDRDTHDLVDERTVADRYHVTVHAVRRWRREGRIAFLKIGKQVLFRPRDIAQFEANHEVPAPTLDGVSRQRREHAGGRMTATGTSRSE